jgi:glycerol uptake facilitator-like aquaporin
VFYRKNIIVKFRNNNSKKGYKEKMFNRFNRLGVGAVLAEFLGTAAFVSVALVLTETTAVSYFIATSVAITLAVIVLMFGSVSGAYVNPAITFGMWTARRIGTLRAVSYIAAQMLGGLAAWQLYQYLTDKPLAAKPVAFNAHLWIAEVVGTLILSLGFAAAASRVFDALQSAIAYSGALFAGIIVASVSSAGLLNPALALGVRSWGATYILGPLVGALIGINLYYLLFAPAVAGSAAVATTAAATGAGGRRATSAKKPAASRGRTASSRSKTAASRRR